MGETGKTELNGVRMERSSLIVGVGSLTKALITGEIQVKGGRWVTTKSMPNNPILRSRTLRDYWFVFGILSFMFAALVWAFLATRF